jgi:hypothetical protein
MKNSPSLFISNLSFNESTGVTRARKDSYQRNISIASSFFVLLGRILAMWLPKNPKKKAKKYC